MEFLQQITWLIVGLAFCYSVTIVYRWNKKEAMFKAAGKEIARAASEIESKMVMLLVISKIVDTETGSDLAEQWKKACGASKKEESDA